MATTKKSRSGPTQPEDRRVNMQVKLRLHPEVVAKLRALAAAEGLELSAFVTRLVESLHDAPGRAFRPQTSQRSSGG